VATVTKEPSPYLAARREWDERYGDLIKRAENWRRAFFLSGFTTLALVVGMISIDMRSHTVPYVVALDDVGRAVPVVPARQVAVKDVRLQEASVYRWINDVRSVVTDPVAQRKMVDEAYAMTAASSAASETLTEWFRDSSPFERLRNGTVDCSIESIVQQSPKAYEIVWAESSRDLFGQVNGIHHYRALVSVTTQAITDSKLALINPLGLFITNVSWGEIVTANGSSTNGGQGK
jgi:type IV secretory pathway TrbF-like protein